MRREKGFRGRFVTVVFRALPTGTKKGLGSCVLNGSHWGTGDGDEESRWGGGLDARMRNI